MHTRVVHINEVYEVFIGRPSKWGNPFIIGTDGTREEVIEKFRESIMKRPFYIQMVKEHLKGKVLGCHCKPEACHGDVLAEIADS